MEEEYAKYIKSFIYKFLKHNGPLSIWQLRGRKQHVPSPSVSMVFPFYFIY